MTPTIVSDMNPLDRAIALCGDQQKLAQRLGVHASNVSHWHVGRLPVPYRHRINIVRLLRDAGQSADVFDFEDIEPPVARDS